MGSIDLTFKVIRNSDSEFSKIRFVHAITCQGFELDPLNLQQICTLARFWLRLKMGRLT